MQKQTRLYFSLLALLGTVTLAGCGMVNGLFSKGIAFGGNRFVEFRVAPSLNHDYPVAVELIVVYSKALEAELMALQARDWFQLRDQYRKDFTTEQYQSWRWEWVPGQSVEPQKFRYEVGALSAILFVSYDSPGDHRERVAPPNQNLRVVLREDDFLVRVLKKKGRP